MNLVIRVRGVVVLIGTLALALPSAAAAPQRGDVEVSRTRHWTGALPAPIPHSPIQRGDLFLEGARPAVMLTGYWPPSNEAVRRFSPDPVQNPVGWIGSNWEGRGYDVYAFFPEFTPPNCNSCGTGTGDLMVDYQDTSTDFWAIAASLRPIAIITFSRASSVDMAWELELNQFNRDSWQQDGIAPYQPTPSPPDASVPVDFLRLSTLPVQAIVEAVDAANLGLSPFVCATGNGGGFLSEFIAYLGVWYQDMHAAPTDPDWCVAAGHVHIGALVPWASATEAAHVTLRTVLDHVDATIACTGGPTVYCVGEPNTAGAGSSITSSGSTSINANDFQLVAMDAIPHGIGVFFWGIAPGQTPFGEGQLCVSGGLFRLFPPLASNAMGQATRFFDLQGPPPGSPLDAGSTGYFQFWYRDTAGGPSGFNLSNALAVPFCP